LNIEKERSCHYHRKAGKAVYVHLHVLLQNLQKLTYDWNISQNCCEYQLVENDVKLADYALRILEKLPF